MLILEKSMEKEARDARIPIMMEPGLVERIDTFRFSNRIGTRAEAVRQLIKSGLEKEMPAQAGQ